MPDTRPRLICVTGGAGFIGSHTVGQLLARGNAVVVLDDLSTGKRTNLDSWKGHPHLELVVTDVADGLRGPLAPVVDYRGPVRGIIHLAAQTSVIRSMKDPVADARTNYLATVQVVDYAAAEGVGSVVFTSSSAVYGDAAELPVTEASPAEPLSPYGVHKRASELALGYAHHVHGLRTTALRLFNVYGPRQDPSSPYSGVISIFLDHAHGGREIRIFGDGEQTRDFVFVGDVARALTDACLDDTADAGALIANIGTGRATTINALARQCLTCCGAQVPVDRPPERAGEIRHSVADISHAHSQLGFDPQTSLEDGLQATADWYREQQ